METLIKSLEYIYTDAANSDNCGDNENTIEVVFSLYLNLAYVENIFLFLFLTHWLYYYYYYYHHSLQFSNFLI